MGAMQDCNFCSNKTNERGELSTATNSSRYRNYKANNVSKSYSYFLHKNYGSNYGRNYQKYIKVNGPRAYRSNKSVGTFFDQSGSYIKGSLIKGEGDAEIYINNNICYKGQLVNNLPNGVGTLKNLLDNSIYVGNFKNGQKTGIGKIQFLNGTLYEGNFLNDKYEGNGKLILPNGCIYEGEFHNNVFDGKGKYIYKDGKIYEGNFKGGLKNGFGKLSWNDSKYYEGYWVNNKPHGIGEFNLKGRTLKGIFRYGTMIVQN